MALVVRVNAAVAQVGEPVQTQVIPAPLHVRGREGDPERVPENRQVLEKNLFLQVLGAGRDQHALPAQNRGDEIGERFPGASTRFGEQHAAVGEDAGDLGCHRELGVACFEAWQGRRERTVAGEDISDVVAERRSPGLAAASYASG